MAKKNQPDDMLAAKLYINLQKMLRCLNFGRSLRGKAPTLTGTQMRVLSFFNERDVIHISEISRSLGMSIQNINNLIHRLEVMGLVHRSRNQRDKRLSDIRLTQKGTNGLAAFRREQLGTLSSVLDRLDPSARNILSATIESAALILERATITGLTETEEKTRKKKSATQ